MEKIITSEDLRNRITFLETKRDDEAANIKIQLLETYEGLKPINLIKKVINEATSSDVIKSSLLTTGVGLVAGFLSKKAVEGESKNPFRKLIGNVAMFGITNLIAKHPETIKSIGNTIMNAINSIKKPKDDSDAE